MSARAMVTVIDFDMGNVGSVLNMLKRLGAAGRLSADHDDILSAERLILPGVGSFGQGMANLRRKGLVEILHEAMVRGIPILGICLGMQLLARTSEESEGEGLGWIEGGVVRFRFSDPGIKVPHMGWNVVTPRPGAVLFRDHARELRFYFVHSYHLQCANPNDVAAVATYGYEFTAAIQKDHIFGVQFHPEKSHRFGKELFRRFLEYPSVCSSRA